MSRKVEIRDKDSVAKEVFPTLESFYSNLSSEWSRFVPEEYQSNGYAPNRLVATKGQTGQLMLNISCYKILDSSKFFLGIIASSNPNGDTEIEAFLAEVPDGGVIEMQFGNHGRPERREVAEYTVESDNKNLSSIVSETTQEMSDLCEQLESKNVKQLLLET